MLKLILILIFYNAIFLNSIEGYEYKKAKNRLQEVDSISTLAKDNSAKEKWSVASLYFEEVAGIYTTINPNKSVVNYMQAVDCELKQKVINDIRVELLLHELLYIYNTKDLFYSMDSLYFAKAHFLQGNSNRKKFISYPSPSYMFRFEKDRISGRIREKGHHNKDLGYFNAATKNYRLGKKYKDDTFFFKSNHAMAHLYKEYSGRCNNVKSYVHDSSKIKEQYLTLYSKHKLQAYKMNALFRSCNFFGETIEYATKNKYQHPLVDSAKVSYAKMGFFTVMSCDTLIEIMEEKQELQLHNKNERFPEDKETIEVYRETQRSIIKKVLQLCDENEINTIWTEKLKQR